MMFYCLTNCILVAQYTNTLLGKTKYDGILYILAVYVYSYKHYQAPFMINFAEKFIKMHKSPHLGSMH